MSTVQIQTEDAAFTMEDLLQLLSQQTGYSSRKLRCPLRHYLGLRYGVVPTNGERLCLCRPIGIQRFDQIGVIVANDGLATGHELIAYKDLEARQWRARLVARFRTPLRKKDNRHRRKERKRRGRVCPIYSGRR